MQGLRLVPRVFMFDTFKEFADDFKIGKRDLLITNEELYGAFAGPAGIETNVMYRGKYGAGEPTDAMIDAMAKDVKKYDIDRIIAFGGGAVIDICKILALDVPEKSVDLFTGKAAPKKIRQLIAVPTTCGTGSEVTNVAIAELIELNVKKGLAVDELYADFAVLIPETMNGLKHKFFITSSIDALIHAIESFLSPKATPFTEIFSLRAIEIIMAGYKEIAEKGEDERFKHLKEFMIASTYAGIAFGNAGCAAVHALSYSIGGAFHVPHGEANYQFFTEVFKMYKRKKPEGKIKEATKLFAGFLGCSPESDVYGELETFLNKLITKKQLREYGMAERQIDEFTDLTIANQQRLLGNNYVFLDRGEIREIFANLY